jgi:drug/metabolite transporter (DMT)-like permease
LRDRWGAQPSVATANAEHTPSNRSSILLLVAAAVLMGAGVPTIRLALDAGADPTPVVMWRFVLGAVALNIVRPPKTWRLVLGPPSQRGMALFLGVAYVAPSLLVSEALTSLPASVVALLLYAYPAFVILVVYIFRLEGIGLRKLIALAMGLTGTTLVAGSTPAGADVTGVVLALIAAAVIAVYIIGVSRASLGLDPIETTRVMVTIGAIAIVIYGILRGEIDLVLPIEAAAWMLLLTVLSTAAVPLFLIAVNRVGAATGSVSMMLEPVVSVALATLVLDERLTSTQLLGGAFVVAALAFVASGPSPPMSR